MTYKALYRIYRPQKFEEVVGQDPIVKTLRNALIKNKIAHAYLFTGPRGTGKTTMAKLFAKALNCEVGGGIICDECESCKAIMEGSHPDVIEVDAASNNSVENIRNIIDSVKYLPIKAKYKVYIIDEVHMLSTGAFNALLKTLEEPPEHVVFILATTEPHKVLPTIVSRCQRYDFSKVEDNDIMNKLIEILEKEGATYEKEALQIIVELADGGVRDSLSMLDQVLAYSADSVTTDDVLTLFAIASKREKIELLEKVANHNIRAVLNTMDELVEAGIDIKRLTSNLLEILRDLLVYEHGGEAYQMLTLTEAEAENLSADITKERCIEMIDVLLKAQSDFKNVANIRSLFEIILLKLCAIEENHDEEPRYVASKPAPVVTPIVSQPQPKSMPRPQEIKPEVVEVVPAPQPTPVAPKVEEKKEDTIPDFLFDDDTEVKPMEENRNNDDLYTLDDDTMIKIMVTATKEERIQLTNKWRSLENIVAHPVWGKYATALVDGRPAVVSKQVLVLEYELNSQVKKINNKASQSGFASIVEKLLGRKVFVFAMNRAESIRLSKLFSSLRQINTLPKPSTIQIKLPVELPTKEN